jgi:hypothetical protein
MSQGYTGPYGNMFGYILGAGAPIGMPAGSLNQNAFMVGVAASYLGNTAFPRRGVAMYSNLTQIGYPGPPGAFTVRLTVPGTVLFPFIVGPVSGIFRNQNGFNAAAVNSPY